MCLLEAIFFYKLYVHLIIHNSQVRIGFSCYQHGLMKQTNLEDPFDSSNDSDDMLGDIDNGRGSDDDMPSTPPRPATPLSAKGLPWTPKVRWKLKFQFRIFRIINVLCCGLANICRAHHHHHLFENVHFFHATLGLDVCPYEVPPHIPEYCPMPIQKTSTFMSSSTHSLQVFLFLPLHLAPALTDK